MREKNSVHLYSFFPVPSPQSLRVIQESNRIAIGKAFISNKSKSHRFRPLGRERQIMGVLQKSSFKEKTVIPGTISYNDRISMHNLKP